jgi:CRISPR-associated protein Cas8a1/Csx13
MTATTTGNSGRVEINLSDPGMTALHRVGLAGLWMTLDAIASENGRAKKNLEDAGGRWTLSNKGIVLEWHGSRKKFFDALVGESFKVDKNGFVWFTALGEPSRNPEASALLNECLLNTFLQHGNTRKADKAGKPGGNVVVNIDDKEEPIEYRRITQYAHRKIEITDTEDSYQLAGWAYPGGAVRHEAFKRETGLREPLARYLPLVYASVGALYFIIKKRGERLNAQYALVIPAVADLGEYASLRKNYAKSKRNDLTVSGPGEAAVRVLAEMQAAKMLRGVGITACRVMAFGKLSWNKQQKVRVGVFDVHENRLGDLRVYRLCHEHLKPRRVESGATGEQYWDYPQVPELVARNILDGREWWRGFSDFVSDRGVGDHVFGVSKNALYPGERKGLAKMVNSQNSQLADAERIFVEACQEAWRRKLGMIGERARQENRDFNDLVRKEFLLKRLAFSKCKNAQSLREAVTSFWAEAGSPISSLQAGWKDVITLLDSDWRAARDLVLLALASYSSPEKADAVPGDYKDNNSDVGTVA